MAIIVYTPSFCQKTAERKTTKKCFFFQLFKKIVMAIFICSRSFCQHIHILFCCSLFPNVIRTRLLYTYLVTTTLQSGLQNCCSHYLCCVELFLSMRGGTYNLKLHPNDNDLKEAFSRQFLFTLTVFATQLLRGSLRFFIFGFGGVYFLMWSSQAFYTII